MEKKGALLIAKTIPLVRILIATTGDSKCVFYYDLR